MALQYALGPLGYLMNNAVGNPLGGGGEQQKKAQLQGKQFYPQAQQGSQQNSMQPYGIQNITDEPKGWGQWAKEGLFGRNESFAQVPTVTPQVMELLQQILGQAGQGLQNPYAGFEPIAQQAREQFNTETIPGLAERFTSLGSGGSQQSSAFQGALGSAGAGLERGLAALQSEYGLRNRESLLSQLKTGLYPQFETLHRPGTSGAVGEAWNTGKQASMQLLKLLPFIL